MGKRWLTVLGAVSALCVGLPSTALGDYFDDFNDGVVLEDPLAYDIDDPNWNERFVFAGAYQAGVDEGRMRITAMMHLIFRVAFVGWAVEDNIKDPNLTPYFYDASQPHYMLANGRTHDENYPPTTGMLGVWLHGDFDAWQSFNFEWEARDGWTSLTSYNGLYWMNIITISADDNNPNYPPEFQDPIDPNYPSDAREKMWFMIQFDPNGEHWRNIDPNYTYDSSLNDPNDPNCYWLRGAMWKGGKFEWNGSYVLQCNLLGQMAGRKVNDEIHGNDFYFDPNNPTHMAQYFHTDGFNCVSGFSGGNAGFKPDPNDPNWSMFDPNNYICAVDASYDDVESRWGYFTNVSHALQLNVKNSNMGTITIDPDLLDDPNDAPWFIHGDPNDPSFDRGDPSTWNDPNDPNSWSGDYPLDPETLRRYTNGTEVVLVAEPLEGKSFKSWTVFDPNYPGDRGHAVEDTNSVLYLTMDADWEVEASFSCGSSEFLPPMGMVLLALVAGVIVRRRL